MTIHCGQSDAIRFQILLAQGVGQCFSDLGDPPEMFEFEEISYRFAGVHEGHGYPRDSAYGMNVAIYLDGEPSDHAQSTQDIRPIHACAIARCKPGGRDTCDQQIILMDPITGQQLAVSGRTFVNGYRQTSTA